MIFRYCPRCRAKFFQRNAKLFVCKKCGLHFYFNVAPAVAVILENNRGEILLTRRKHQPMKGYWDLPGGFVDANETLEEAAKRELKEELGI